MASSQPKPTPLDLVRMAVLAPTPDNNQPWRFVEEEDGLRIELDPQRALPSDVNSMFDLMGVGAGIENAAIAARRVGFDLEVEVPPTPADGVKNQPSAAVLRMVPGGNPDPLEAQVAARATCRKLYSTRPVAEDALARLADAASGFPEVQVDWITDRTGIRAFARVVTVSDRFRFEYEPFHREIFRQLRFSAADAERTRDGLDVRTLELPPGAALILRQLRSWNRMRWLHRFRLGRLLTLPSGLSVRKSGALGLLSLPRPSPEGFIRGGRAFQRIWLAAEKERLALQPLGSLPIFIAQQQQLQGRNLTAEHRQLSVDLARRLQDLVPSTQGRTLVMLFRLGFATPTRVRSLRRPAEEVFQTASGSPSR